MKLIRSTTLAFKKGTSDKVYEVDLGQEGDNQYVVNFRFGRRGADLKDGTKTPTPVPLPEAEKEFTDLVESKIKKGYHDTSQT